MVGNLANAITCANFQGDIFRVTLLQGFEFPISVLIFAWALQQRTECSANLLPVMLTVSECCGHFVVLNKSECFIVSDFYFCHYGCE